PEAVPPAVPVDGAPHLAAPQIPAQPGPAGGVEQAAPAAPLGAPA
ncbi:hypothetical protein H7K04_00195, partial [Mycolicibacterium fluoranthenivorans]|nr:hypothetical protein [Mycolicibacterium fluoranthenivorans]